jgi:hypothetical protein
MSRTRRNDVGFSVDDAARGTSGEEEPNGVVGSARGGSRGGSADAGRQRVFEYWWEAGQ